MKIIFYIINKIPRIQFATTTLMLFSNVGLYLFLLELSYILYNGAISPMLSIYVFAITMLCTLIFGVFVSAILKICSSLDNQMPLGFALSHVSAIFCAFPQAFVTAHMMRSFEQNVLISITVFMAVIIFVSVVIYRLCLNNWSFFIASSCSAFFCIHTMHSDTALSRVSQEHIDIFFLYLHAMPFISLMLTAYLVLVFRYCRSRISSKVFSILSLIASIVLFYGVLKKLNIDSPEITRFVQFALFVMTIYGVTRIQIIRKKVIALTLWGIAIIIAIYFAAFGKIDIGLPWIMSNKTVFSAAVVKELNLYENYFSNIPLMLKKHPSYREGKNTLKLVNEWNRKNASSVDNKNMSVLLITIDALRFDVLGKNHPNQRSYTPNLDKLYKKSVYFNNAYAQGGWTSISVPSFIWSRYPRFIRFAPLWEDDKLGLHMENVAPKGRKIKKRFQTPIDETSDNIAKILNNNNYTTYAINNDGGTSYFHPDLGFSKWFRNILYPKHIREKEETPARRKMHLDEVTANSTIQVINSSDDKKPFFIWTHLYAPHASYDPPKGYGIPFEDYKGEVYFSDMMVGRILKALRASKKDKNTMVIIHGDHGESIGQHHGISSHGRTLYDDAIKVPLLISIPKQKNPKAIETPVGLIDVAPTVLDFLGISIPKSMHGITLRSVIEGTQTTFNRHPVYLETWAWSLKNKYRLNLTGVVYKNHKLVKDVIAKTHAMYDLKRDPSEKQNLLLESEKNSASLFLELGGYLEGWSDINIKQKN